MSTPKLVWDYGTAFDLFVSLMVLHEPARYDLRGAWARGVRARLSADEREILEQAKALVWPMRWVHLLPPPKDGATVLRALARVPAKERLPALAFAPDRVPEAWEIWQNVAARGSWDERDRVALVKIAREKKADVKKDALTQALEWWSRPAEFGERYLAALESYYRVFFAEEEARIRPALESALARAQALAQRLDLAALLEELSQGLRLTELPQVAELALAPSFWCTPLLVFVEVSHERHLLLFGARPSDASLVPGETVPDALMRALKALGDPTRLRILRYLSAEPLSPTQLARRLRLRTPTVIHHLDKLRMAGLVHLTLGERGEKRRYAARAEAVKAAYEALETFLNADLFDEHE